MRKSSRAALVLSVAAAGALTVGAGSASAATESPSANCIGSTASNYNSYAQGLGGQFIAYFAPGGYLGAVAPGCKSYGG